MLAEGHFNDEFFEWEERKDDVPFQVHMVAGSAAGISEHVSLLPLDNIKTHRQSLLLKITIPETINVIYDRPGGIFNFWRGSMVMALGCIPAHALFFSIYEYSKNRFGIAHSNEYHPELFAAVGAISSAFHDMIMLPCEGTIGSDISLKAEISAYERRLHVSI